MQTEANKEALVLSLLREKTQKLHHEIEAKLDIMNPQLNTQGYIQILESFYSFYLGAQSAWEKQTPDLKWVPDFKEKIQSLEKDFRILGHTPSSKKKSFDEKITASAWWGVLYVTEGSNLGSQVICKHLSSREEICDALNFYQGHGLETGKRWRHFLAELNSPELLSKEEIAKAAVAAFSLIIDL